MKLLALDQSTKKTGWSIYEDETFVACGLIDYESNDDPAERFIEMCKAVNDMVLREKPDFLVMEGVAYQRNAAVLIELAQLQGVIIGACLSNQIEFYIYPPSSWRKELGIRQGKNIKREALKSQAIAYVEKMFGTSYPEDTAEAICIASAFLHLNKRRS